MKEKIIRIITRNANVIYNIHESKEDCFFRANGTMTVLGSTIVRDAIVNNHTLSFEYGHYNARKQFEKDQSNE